MNNVLPSINKVSLFYFFLTKSWVGLVIRLFTKISPVKEEKFRDISEFKKATNKRYKIKGKLPF